MKAVLLVAAGLVALAKNAALSASLPHAVPRGPKFDSTVHIMLWISENSVYSFCKFYFKNSSTSHFLAVERPNQPLPYYFLVAVLYCNPAISHIMRDFSLLFFTFLFAIFTSSFTSQDIY